MLRPDVVLFGEMLPDGDVREALPRVPDGLRRRLQRRHDQRLSLHCRAGALGRVTGRPTIEINPAQSKVSDLVDVKLSARAAAALDAIWGRYQG